jgi:hypothetical protein
MVDIFTKLLPRDVLATFLPDPRSIRAFEDLQQDLIDAAEAVTAIQSARVLVAEANAGLTGAQVFTPGAGLSVVDGGAGAAYEISVDLTATAPLAYDDASATISHDVSGVVASTYGSATKSAVITVDEFGHLTEVTEATISGGGGGSAFGEFAYDPPLIADLPTDVIAAGATFGKTDVTGKGLSLTVRNVGTGRAAACVTTAPSLPFTATIRAVSQNPGVNNPAFWGIVLRNSSNGRSIITNLDRTPVFGFQQWSTIDTFNATLASKNIGGAYGMSGAYYIAMNVSAGNVITAYWSLNGVTWVSLGTTNVSTYLTAAGGLLDQVGIWLGSDVTTAGIDALVSYWRIDAINPPAVAL